MPRLVFSSPDPSQATITDEGTGAVVYRCTRGDSSHSFTMCNAEGGIVAVFDDSSFTTKVVFGGRIHNLKDLLPRKSILSEYAYSRLGWRRRLTYVFRAA